MTKLTSSGVEPRTVRSGASRRLSPGLRIALVGVVAAIGLAGCGSTTSSSASTSATPSAIASSAAIPSATPALSPTAAPPLSFVATGSMHTARERATATLLKNGKVLIAGGEAQNGLPWTVYASAELYDPATGKFTNTGSMAAARGKATAIALSDGRVLIAGGEGCKNPKACRNIDGETIGDLASAEIYDPATGKFTTTGSMTDVTRNSAAALLPDGKVLIVGQVNSWGQLYDPATGKFVRTGEVGNFDVPFTATLLPSGKVLVTGHGAAPQLYDEASGKFTDISLELPAGTPKVAYDSQWVLRRGAPDTATLLKDGRVLLFDSGYLETYDPATGVCADAGFISPAGKWEQPTATLLADGSVLYEGGRVVGSDGNSTNTNVAILYDPTGGSSRKGSTQVAREYQTATLLQDGSVLIAGGEEANSKALASAELFKP
jgi:hypothetical protein